MRIVLDTNCLLQIIGHESPVHKAWTEFIEGNYTLCYSNDILMEYEEIIGRIISPAIISGAKYIVSDDAHFDVLKTIPFPHVDVLKLQQFVDLL